VTAIFRWTGEYFGFIVNKNLLDINGTYLGWIEDDQVWGSDVVYLGEVVEENYILRRAVMIPRIPRIPRIPPIPPIPPIPEIDRIGRVPRVGWVDALDDFWPNTHVTLAVGRLSHSLCCIARRAAWVSAC